VGMSIKFESDSSAVILVDSGYCLSESEILQYIGRGKGECAYQWVTLSASATISSMRVPQRGPPRGKLKVENQITRLLEAYPALERTTNAER
jgi:hypothetical protein